MHWPRLKAWWRIPFRGQVNWWKTFFWTCNNKNNGNNKWLLIMYTRNMTQATNWACRENDFYDFSSFCLFESWQMNRCRVEWRTSFEKWSWATAWHPYYSPIHAKLFKKVQIMWRKNCANSWPPHLVIEAALFSSRFSRFIIAHGVIRVLCIRVVCVCTVVSQIWLQNARCRCTQVLRCWKKTIICGWCHRWLIAQLWG